MAGVLRATLSQTLSLLAQALGQVHHLTEDDLAKIEAGFREFAELIIPDETPSVIKDDPDDDHFLEPVMYCGGGMPYAESHGYSPRTPYPSDVGDDEWTFLAP